MTATVYHKILGHLKEKFVNLPGITKQIREKRQQQNVRNFHGSIFFLIWRFCSVIPVCIVSLLPNEILLTNSGFYLYFITQWIISVYETCGVSFFFMATYTIFNKTNEMGKNGERALFRKITNRFRNKLRLMKEQILDFDLLVHAPWTTVNRHHNLYRHPSLDMPINVHQDNLMLAPLNLARGTLIQKMIGFGQIMMRFFYDIFCIFSQDIEYKMA